MLDPEKLAAGLHEYLARAFRPIVARLEMLEQQQQKTLADSYQGSYLAGKTYERGAIVTKNGALWLAMIDSNLQPGENAAWKMIVSRGRDARDR